MKCQDSFQPVFLWLQSLRSHDEQLDQAGAGAVLGNLAGSLEDR